MIIFCDIDGVVTDGCYYLDNRLGLIKGFNTRDFHAINKFCAEKFQFVFLTASNDSCTKNKCAAYNLELVSNCNNKKQAVLDICTKNKCKPEDCVFIGDGPQDFLAMSLCGSRYCPSDASMSIKECPGVYVLSSCGGRGAIDEMLYIEFNEKYKQIMLS